MRAFLLPLFLVACAGPDTTIAKHPRDADGDGYTEDVDCDDAHATVNPDAEERCDEVDNNCDGVVDDDATDRATWHTDADGDGFGDPAASAPACAAPAGTVADATDCDDAEAAAFPGNPEVCDAIDNDCDGAVDDDATDVSTFYVDADGDGHGDPATALIACEAGPDEVTAGDDCDDGAAAIHPGATEDDCADPTDYNCDGSVGYADADGDGAPACEDCDDADVTRSPLAAELCDALDADEDCDGASDDDDASVTGAPTWGRDADGDGYAGAGTTLTQCEAPTGYAFASGDCDDFDSDANPGALELCDAADVDEDCDGLVDGADPSTDAASWFTWYGDRDGDAYGDGARTVAQCEAPSGYVGNDDDCDDANAARNPGEAEVCDAADLDEDCDGLTDDADTSVTGGSTWYADTDGDGYGGIPTRIACAQPTGHVANDDDCNDASASVSPAATEVCDSANTDEDCDGVADDADTSATGKGTWYRDVDGDGYAGSTASSVCDPPVGYYASPTDCNDAVTTISPAAAEVCDAANVDEDCDGPADDGDASATGRSTWYRDADADGYGGTTTTAACEQPTGYLATSSDCDDANAAVSPGDREVCDASNVDEDCDGVPDDLDASATGASTWYRDADGDSYGNASIAATTCDLPTGYVANDDDCDDTTSSVGNNRTWYRDADGDGYGVSTTTSGSCIQPAGYVAVSGDCNDASAAANPAAAEVCDTSNVDEDCDGLADDLDSGATGKATWYRDADSDAYGSATSSVAACDLPSGYVASATDCNDANAAVSPGDPEVCDISNVDEDCDGLVDDLDTGATGKGTWYRDADADTYGSATTSLAACDLPSGYVANATDCNDADAAVSPGDPEVCDIANVDEDCDGLVDDLDTGATGKGTWYRDADGDSYGSATSTTPACDLPSGYVTTGTDCDDGSAAVSPAGTEVCDTSNVDEDCDGLADDADTSATGETTWFLDADGDSYGVATSTLSRCDQPSSHVPVSTDCDDTASDAHPGGTEVCGDDIDQDCLDGDEECPIGGYVGSFGVDSGYDTKIYGPSYLGHFGEAMVAGDFDGDGDGDLLVGASDYLYTGAVYGAVFGYYGPFVGGSQVATDNDSLLIHASLTASSGIFGQRLANIGDINGDERHDFFVERTWSSSAVTQSLYYGGDTGTWSQTMIDDEEGTLFACTAAAPVGNFNGTGNDEWACGYAPGNVTGSRGSVSVWSGTTNVGSIAGVEAWDFLGASLGAGDVNGDGYKDLWFGAYGDDDGGGDAGAAYLVYAAFSGSFALSSADGKILADDAYDYFGYRMASPGDVDGDGYDDVIVTAWANNTMGADAGAVYLFTSPASGRAASLADAVVYGERAGDQLGVAEPQTGDFNGDGELDLLLGTQTNDDGGTDAGSAWLVYGPLAGTMSVEEADGEWLGAVSSDGLGTAVAAIPDTDGDGRDEIAMSAPMGDGGGYTDQGAVWIWHGE